MQNKLKDLPVIKNFTCWGKLHKIQIFIGCYL